MRKIRKKHLSPGGRNHARNKLKRCNTLRLLHPTYLRNLESYYEVAKELPIGATDRYLIDLQAWLADTNRHRLALLATYSNSLVQRQVVADH